MSAMSWSSSRMSSTICAQHANVLSLTVPTPWLAVQNRGLLQVLNSTLASRWLLAGQMLLAGVQVEQEALRAQASMDERCSNPALATAHPADAADALADRLDVGLEVPQAVQRGPRDGVRDAQQLRVDGALQPRQLAVQQPGVG